MKNIWNVSSADMNSNDINGQTHVTHKGWTGTVDEINGNEANTRITATGLPHYIAAREEDDGAAITLVPSSEHGTGYDD